MDSHVRFLVWILLVVAAAYLIWTMVRSSRWMRLQAESAERQRNLMGRSAQAEQVVGESIKIQEEQLRLTRELVGELKGLREDSEERQKALIARSAEAERNVREMVRLQEELLRLTREMVGEIKALREGLERRNA
ncbi:MAG TPA: hypothetical protein VN775_05300 [Opitutaceae bacterium]|nr:hypothetical protein [Opitutaceae bacterium]